MPNFEVGLDIRTDVEADSEKEAIEKAKEKIRSDLAAGFDLFDDFAYNERIVKTKVDIDGTFEDFKWALQQALKREPTNEEVDDCIIFTLEDPDAIDEFITDCIDTETRIKKDRGNEVV